jgi:SAM-dependent methyltransferase
MAVLDVFCGGAEVLIRIRNQFKKFSPKLVGFEPLDFHYESALHNLKTQNATEDVVIFRDERELANSQLFDFVLCLESFEHMDKAQNSPVLALIHSRLQHDGKAIFSVPIEIGLISLVKNVMRRLTGHRTHGDNLRNILLSTFNLTRHIDTGQSNSINNGHMGFDYRMMEELLTGAKFEIMRRVFSPFPRLPSSFNSQVFYIVRSAKWDV